jgi:hypothetical protein
MSSGPTFNDDVLLHAEDRKRALAAYPGLEHLLDFPELRAEFGVADDTALRAKRRARRSGYLAVVLTTLGLLGASVSPLFHGSSWAADLSLVSAGCGLFGAAIAVFGLLHGRAKHGWITQRLFTERLRQFHFQAWMADLDAVADSLSTPAARQQFVGERGRRLAILVQRLKGHADAELERVIDESDTGEPWIDQVPRRPTAQALQALPPAFFQAYLDLRLLHQLNYAVHMLRPPHSPLAANLRARHRLLTLLGTVCVLGLFVLDMTVAVAMGTGAHLAEAPLHALAVSLAVIALAARAVEEGTQTKVEISRYQGYRNTIQNLVGRYMAAIAAQRRDVLVDVMVEMERLSFLEMKSFLVSHAEARFVM